jgi:hypothetical protein
MEGKFWTESWIRGILITLSLEIYDHDDFMAVVVK